MNEDKLPNFLIVGAAKAGTTSIHSYLKQHPEIFMSEKKEPCFFTFHNEPPPVYSTGRSVNFVHSFSVYKKLFETSNSFKIRGESSTPYLFFYDRTIENIKSLIPNHKNIKILIVLRDPTERAYSQYMMKVRDVVEPLSFEDSIENEEKRVGENAHFDFFYTKRGLYKEQVQAYMENFNNVKIMFFEDFKNNPRSFLKQVVDFLEVQEYTFKLMEAENTSGVPRVKMINAFLLNKTPLKKVISILIPARWKKKIRLKVSVLNNAPKPKMNENTREKLRQYYKPNLIKLGNLINEDLTRWYSKI